ncbi:MAG: pyridoxamine 5'-phosphate oxidase family protein [Kiritimatiellae bacterium]|jgi:nitroimidazol reductase NimA-like FMN-containing flavoprotein (pyridoxamine 5'-phosphate oxidase superfamily)|nr:pyridoxamine 5'-phosphate oxidase family protein [Kiritimatiellia bacterium]
MNENILITPSLKELIDSQLFGILSSCMKEYPYLNLMAFIPYDNYKSLIFATARETLKYCNLKEHPECSIFIDNQRNQSTDSFEAKGVSACGKAYELITGNEYNKITKLYLKRHPAMANFIKSPTIAVFKMQIDTYSFVENFENVTKIHIS